MSETALTTVAKSNTDFSVAMYRVLTEGEEDDQNLIFSPYSISAVMAMLKLGANGRTAIYIRNAMKYPESDETLVNGYKDLIQVLKGSEDFTLQTVNKIYCMSGFKIKDTFTSQIKEYFNATISQLDFSNGDYAAKEINGFVEKVTGDRIKGLVKREDFNHFKRLVLVNAIYFKGIWKYPFNKKATKDADFYIGNGQRIKVPMMMHTKTYLPYAEIQELDAKAVAVPYQGDNLYMIILLPNQVNGMKEMEAALSNSNFNLRRILTNLWPTLINLTMPRFKLESTIDLSGPFGNLGAASIFNPKVANFSNIPENPEEKLHVTKAVQKAFIEVNEERSETEAVTSFGVPSNTSIDSKPIELYLNVDHPFLSIIVHKLNVDCNNPYDIKCYDHELLFMSKVSNPSQVSRAPPAVISPALLNPELKMGTEEPETAGVGKISDCMMMMMILGILTTLTIIWSSG